jgi:rare lipoprotein A
MKLLACGRNLLPSFLCIFLAACAPQATGPKITSVVPAPEAPVAVPAPEIPAVPVTEQPPAAEIAESVEPPSVAKARPADAGTIAAESVPAPATAGPSPPVEEKPVAASPAPLPADVGYESRATYYSKWFDGRPTITDEIYDPNKMTAATNDLPLGTLARVINPKNGREVIVRINDRPRKRTYPLIDLSRAAAKQLGFFGKGLIRVRVIPLPPEAPEYKTLVKKKKKK